MPPRPLRQRIYRHLRDTFGWRESKLGLWHGVQFAFSIAVPALVGAAMHNLELGFIGALAGLLFALGDSTDALQTRLVKLAQTAAATLILGTIGALVGAGTPAFWGLFLLVLLAIGYFSLSGHTLTASMRLGAISFVAVAGLPTASFSLAAMVIFAALLNGATRVLGHYRFPNSKAVVPPADAFAPLPRIGAARFCGFYVVAAVASLLIGQSRGVSHPVWIATTVLLVMQPDARASVARILQRGFGTFCGVVAAALTVTTFHSTPALLLAITALAFLTPYAATRNYWGQSALIAWLILVLYDFALAAKFSPHLLTERLGDVSIGCALAFLATLGAFWPGRRSQGSRTRS